MDKEFETLLSTYRQMFGMIDAIHFNSQNTADVYNKYIEVPKESSVIPITHNGISDCRQCRRYDQKKLRLGFIGSISPFKGLPMLKKVIKKLNGEGLLNSIILNVYDLKVGIDEDTELSNIVYKGRFGESQMSEVYDSMDLLVVPSIWNETFGFIVLEAFQYGVPSLVSSRVGAKDIVKQYAPQLVFETETDLYTIIRRLIDHRDDLMLYNKRIIELPWQWSMGNHVNEIVEKIYKKNHSTH